MLERQVQRLLNSRSGSDVFDIRLTAGAQVRSASPYSLQGSASFTDPDEPSHLPSIAGEESWELVFIASYLYQSRSSY
jgi:hypothetical protein